MVTPHEFVSNSRNFSIPHAFVMYAVSESKSHESVMFGSDSRTGDMMSTQMIGAEEVAKALNTSKGYAYKVIRKLNDEMEEGMLVVKGKVSADYFAERYFGKDGGRDVR